MISKHLGVWLGDGASRRWNRILFVAGWVLCVCAAAVSQGAMIDNFESYQTGLVSSGVTGGVWTALTAATPIPANSDTGTIQEEAPNKFLSIGPTTNNNSGVYRALPSAIPGGTAATTLFFRTRANGNVTLNTSIGLSDGVPTTANDFNAFEPQLRVFSDTGGGNKRFNVRNGGAFTDLTVPTSITADQWYNVWMVVNTATDKWDIYINQGFSDATAADLKMSNIGFRHTGDANTALSQLLVYAGTGGSLAVSVDDFYISEGLSLVNPVPEPTTIALVFAGAWLFFTRRRALDSGRRSHGT